MSKNILIGVEIGVPVQFAVAPNLVRAAVITKVHDKEKGVVNLAVFTDLGRIAMTNNVRWSDVDENGEWPMETWHTIPLGEE